MSSETSETTTFTELLARVPSSLESGQVVHTQMPSDWGQGRSSFGGALTGIALAAMEAVLPRNAGEPARRCRSMLVSFVGPIAAGPIELSASVVRHGRSATNVSASVAQGGSVGCSIMASFASPRPSAIEIPSAPRPELVGPEGLVAMPFVPGLVPSFVRHFELRWASGGPPGAGLAGHSFTGWGRFREHAERPLGPAWIAALVDIWPTPAMQMLRMPAPASSLTWALDFVDEDPQAASDEFWAIAVETDRASGGWVHTRARLWSPSGMLVATSSQTVALFA